MTLDKIATKLTKNKEALKLLTKISILAKNPASGGTPAKLKKANIPLKPNNGFEFPIEAKSINVLLFSLFTEVFRDKTTDQIDRLVNM